MSDYPEIIIPKSIRTDVSVKYEVEFTQEPKKPIQEEIEDTKKGCFSTSVIIALLVGFFLLILFGGSQDVGFIIAIVLLFSIVGIYKYFSLTNENADYEKKLEEQSKVYAKKLHLYNQDFAKYVKAHDFYKTINFGKGLTNMYPSLKKRFIERVRDFNQCKIELSHSHIKKGASEWHFNNQLALEFGKKNHSNTTITIGNGFFNKKYHPDFLIINEAETVFIDVEIDEPYVLETGEPIHYGYDDSIRNDAFEKNLFVVVRFAEEQIVKHPRDCIKTIDSILSFLERKVDSWESKVPMVNKWTKQEAQEMAENYYREKYLGINPIQREKDEKPDALWHDDLPF